MNWATRRKLIYFSCFMFLAVLLIGVPIFLATYQKPTCFDNEQNQGEEGVDCGGPCVKLCKPLQLLPVVLWDQAFSVIPKVYTAAAYVQNPNIHAKANNVAYTFTLYDARNQILAERKGVTNIPAGQNFLVIEPNIQIASATPVRTEFTFLPNYNWTVADTKPIVLIHDRSYATTSSPTITANLANSTYDDIGRTDVAVVLYDEDGNAFAVSKTYVDAIPRQSTVPVTFTWPAPFSKNPANIEIIPVIND